MKNYTFYLLFFLFATMHSYAQISGRVVDKNSKPLSGVSILVKGTIKGTQTNSKGYFEISKVSGNKTLTVSLLGYKRLSLNVTAPKNNLQITLNNVNTSLDEIVVDGKLNKTKVPSSSLRLKTPIKELPQNVQIVSDELLESQMITNMADGAFRNVSGVSSIEHWGHFARVNMRGFRLPAFRNGINIQDSWGPLSEDMFMVDKIEFVKGPSGFMMSLGEPGGFYNVVTKKPTKQRIAQISVQAGTQDTYRGSVDFGGVVGNDERFLYRFNAMYQSKGTHRIEQKSGTRFGIAPALSYQITPKTKALAEFTYQQVTDYIGSAYVFNTTSKGYGSLDRDFSMIDKTFPQSDMNEVSILLRLTHNFNDNWSIEGQYTSLGYYQEGASFWSWALDAAGNADRHAGIWDAISEGEYFQIYMNGKFDTGFLSHKIMGGLDFTQKNYWANFAEDKLFSTPFNVNNPTYIDSPEITFNRNYNLRDSDPYYGSTIHSLYLQDELSFLDNKVRLTLAGRYTKLDPRGRIGKKKEEKFTPRVGLSVDVLPELTVYGLFDQSFLPNNVDPASVKPGVKFDPIKGTIYEGGLKSSLFDNKLMASLSAYKIIKNNLPLAGSEINPVNGQPYLFPDSEVTSEGIEVDINGKITNELSVVLNYANTNVENSKGDRIAGHAKHINNTWLTYNFNENTALKGFGISLGYQYLIDRSTWTWAGADQKSDLPDYFRLDGGITWKNNKWRVALNVNNLLNKYLYSGANYGSYVYWQSEPGTNGRISVTYNL